MLREKKPRWEIYGKVLGAYIQKRKESAWVVNQKKKSGYQAVSRH